VPPAASAAPGASGEDAPDPAEQAAARDTEARHLFEAGRNAYDAGRYQDALDYFQRGHELSGRPQLLYNVGQAADRLRLDQTALDAFKLYLERLPDAENRPQVEERIRVLEEVLAQKQALAASSAVPASAAAPGKSDPLATGAPDTAEPRDDENLLNQWWFWAGAGGVVVVGVVLAVVISSSGGGDKGGEPTPGSDGVTIAVLSLP
jgi:tetratricopeptide (TPR) repeat protein